MTIKQDYSKLFKSVESYLEEELNASDERLPWQIEEGYLVKSVRTRFGSRLVITMMPLTIIETFLDMDIYCKFKEPKLVAGRLKSVNYSPYSGKYNYTPFENKDLFENFKRHLSLVLPEEN